MDTGGVFTSDGLGSGGMEGRYYPTVFTSPAWYECVMQGDGLTITAGPVYDHKIIIYFFM